MFAATGASSRAAAPAMRAAMVSTSRAGVAASAKGVQSAAPKRGMMMMAKPPPEYTGIEKVVRHYLPEDRHFVCGIVGFYVVGYFVVKGVMKTSAKPEPEKVPEVAAPVSSTSGEIPQGDEFWAWIDAPGNLEKYLATIDK